MTTHHATRPVTSAVQVQEGLDRLFRLEDEDAGELLLLRHARPACDRDGAPSDPMLSCEGLRQAELLAERLSAPAFEAVYTAPERRCLQTARVVADALQRPLQIVQGLADVAFDAAEARGDAVAYAARFVREPRWDALPGFEPGKAFRRRAVEAVEALIAAHPARRCAVVTHASVLNAYLSMLLCIPRDQFFAPDHASISTVRHRGDMYGLRGLNDTSHLAPREPIPVVSPALTPRSLPLTNP